MADLFNYFCSRQQEHINYTNHKIHSYDQMRKLIVNLGSIKSDNIQTPLPHYSFYRM